jgi:hypothetical protein
MSEPINDGGPAFPDDRWQAGMTLRDYFAAAALQGLLADNGGGGSWDSDAKNAYEAADAMIRAREAK